MTTVTNFHPKIVNFTNVKFVSILEMHFLRSSNRSDVNNYTAQKESFHLIYSVISSINTVFIPKFSVERCSHSACIATVHPGLGQPVNRDEPGHFS